MLRISEKLTAENISNWIKNMTIKFNSHYEIATVVTHNAANIKAEVHILRLSHLSWFWYFTRPLASQVKT